MIEARKAKEQTQMNEALNYKSRIEKEINRSIRKGRNFFFITGKRNEEIEKELTDKGYAIEYQCGRIKISW